MRHATTTTTEVSTSTEGSGGARGAEVLGRHLVEELAEFLHLILFHRLGLVGDLYAGLVEDCLGPHDWDVTAKRQGDGVRRTGLDLQTALEDDHRVEDPVLQGRDAHLA